MAIRPEQIVEAQELQHRAAHDPSKQVRLVAGPGTGKSFSIEERVRWLLEGEVPPEGIFVVSFTRASTKDLRRRIRNYCEQNAVNGAEQVNVSTLHSLGLKILRRANRLGDYPVTPSVLDDWELDNIFDTEFAAENDFSKERCSDIRTGWEAFWATEEWEPDNYDPPENPISEEEKRLFTLFRRSRAQLYACVLPGEILRKCVTSMQAGTLDCVRLLNMNNIIVDEYQDLNKCDLAFLDQLVAAGVTIFVTGDDDQSIYSFRYAFPSGIQGFNIEYPEAGLHQLEHCFRCTPKVLAAGSALLDEFGTNHRIPKTFSSVFEASDPPVQGFTYRWRFDKSGNEGRCIAQSCRNLIDGGLPADDILILLVNSRALKPWITRALNEAGVEYEFQKGDEYLAEDAGRFLFSLLRIISNGEDYIAHRTLLGCLPGVGPVTCMNIGSAALQRQLNFHDLFHRRVPPDVFTGREVRALERTRNILSCIADWSSEDMLGDRINEILDLVADTFDAEARNHCASILQELPMELSLEELRDYFWAENPGQQQKILIAVGDRLGRDPTETQATTLKVRIMTVHKAKGLQGSVAFIPGLEEEIFPGNRRRRYAGLVAEAARILYVGITRARIACILSYSEERYHYGEVRTLAPSGLIDHTGGAFGPRTRPFTEVERNMIIADNLEL